MEGYFPENDIDHIDRNKVNNNWDNLREVSTQCNVRNSTIQKNNTSGVTGVCRDNYKKEKWRVRITINKKEVHIGTFDNFDSAVKSRWKAEIKYGFPTCNSTSTAYLYLKKNNLL